jgi:peptidoglycan hydrolase CwlO-like protein
MNFKVTPNNLTRLEKIFSEIKYELRFEKGTFNSGYCVLEHKKVVVINKFLNLEGRINSLLDILSTMQLDDTLLTPESLKLYKQIVENRNALQAAEAAEEVAEAEAAAAAEAAKTAEAAAAEVEQPAAETEQPSTEVEKSPSDNTSEEENPSPAQPSEN